MYEDSYQQQPTATWNSARGVWETNQVNLLCGHSEPFLETWPTSGMTRDGQVFELPTQALLTTDSESSSSPIQEKLFATPNTMDSLPPRFGEAYEKVRNAGGRKNRASSGNLREQVVHVLPTPAVNDMGGNKTVEWWDEWTEKTRLKHNNGNGHGPSLTIEMLRLLPTPVASEGTKAPAQQDAQTKGKTGQVWLSNVAKGISNDALLPTPNTMEHLPARTEEQIAESKKRSPAGYNNLREKVLHEATNWGKFEPAIKRWEQVLGRTAPAPTKPDGKDDQHRLSSAFTEWMMGLPEGWITDAGLKRNDELKACGNGVVPQQAEMALRLLLSDSNMTLERERERESSSLSDSNRL